MRVIEQLVHHFWARGALPREEALDRVRYGSARESDPPGLFRRGHDTDPATREPPRAQADEDSAGDDDKACEAEELEDEVIGRNSGSRKAGGRKKKPTGHNLAPAVGAITTHLTTRIPCPALMELGNQLVPCPTWRDAAKVVGRTAACQLETALVGLLMARPQALGELWFWFDLESLFEWAGNWENAGPVSASLAKLLGADRLAQVGRLGQLMEAGEVQVEEHLLPARRAFLNLFPVLYHAHFP